MGLGNFTITVKHDEGIREIKCNHAERLLDVLNRNGIYIEAPCGGKCLCGKCKVRIKGEGVSKPTSDELAFMSEYEKSGGIRLACAVRVQGQVEVQIDNNCTNAHIVSGGTGFEASPAPMVKKKYVELEIPDIKSQQDDLERLSQGLGIDCMSTRLKTLRQLPDLLRENNFKVTAVHYKSELINVEGGNTEKSNYGVAVDIGTTTVVAYLLDLYTGKQIDVLSGLNSQKSFGSDVISRVTHSIENPDGLNQLRERIVSQLNEMVKCLLDRNKVNLENTYSMFIAGNTIMLHLFAGVTPKNIACAPFIPAITQSFAYNAKELGLDLADTCKVFLMPCISGYVGADIVAGMLSSGMYSSNELSLLLDIGTNGEIAMGNKEGIVCCSTAAGPAFEGAQIRNGVGGVDGAINTVRLEDHQIKYTTISNSKPIGICGSGIVDAVAVLLEAGIIDETGRFVDEDEVSGQAAGLFSRVIEVDGMRAFLLVSPEETKSREALVLTQKDIREVQLAKASIAAGINILLKEAGVKASEVDKVYLAGGFGSYIDKASALKIGLLPEEFRNKISVIGNAAGTGAVMSLLSEECYKSCETIKSMAKYIELSIRPDFQEEFVNCMYFE